jgi:hypothetical protein
MRLAWQKSSAYRPASHFIVEWLDGREALEKPGQFVFGIRRLERHEALTPN